LDIDQFNLVLVAVSLVVIVAVAAVRVSTRAGLPTLLIYLALGLFLGEAGLGLEFDDAALAQLLGLGLLAIILAEGGLTTRWLDIKPVLGPALVLATFGVAVSIAVTAGIAYWLLDVNLQTALLLGAVVSSTDAAAVFAVMRRLPVKQRLKATLEAESGFNDAPVVIIVALLVSDAWEETNVWVAGGQMLYQLIVGAALGFAIAWLGELVLRRATLPSSGLYPIATIAIAILAFGTAGVIGASSFMAVYITALHLGNAKLPHAGQTRGFAEGLAWLAQIALFVLLGLLASPARLVDAIIPALIIGTGLLLVARPLSVLVSVLPFRTPWRDQAFLSWAGLRGAVPIVLATIPINAGLPAATQIFDIVFVLVVIFTLIQAPVLPWLARRLRVDHVDTEPVPDDESKLSVIEFQLPSELSIETGIQELGLPTKTVVAAIHRGGRTFVPDASTVLQARDRLVIVVPKRSLAGVEKCLQEMVGGHIRAEKPHSDPEA
jgi:potassium/hydrogen antiporter